jgi:hypothetical protein
MSRLCVEGGAASLPLDADFPAILCSGKGTKMYLPVAVSGGLFSGGDPNEGCLPQGA